MAKTKGTAYMTALLALLLGVGLLANSAAVGEGIRRGLEVCAGALIPALFPFMVLCCFLTRTDAARILSIPLTPLTTGLLRLPKELGATVLLSLIGGYPVGAKMIANLLKEGEIDQTMAERMLCFCVNASPSFLISAVGVGMLGSRRAGVLLLTAQTAATLIVGAVTALRAPRPPKTRATAKSAGAMAAFVAAVGDASSSMLGMCAFAVLFAGLLSLLSAAGLPLWLARALRMPLPVAEAGLAGLLEVTGGCMAAAELGGEATVILLSLCCSFGGLSVIFQIISCFDRLRIRFRPFLLSRGMHCILAGAISLFLFRRESQNVDAMLSTATPILKSDSRTWLITICLLGMCTIVLAGFGNPKNRKEVDRF